jgi:hypothetical protein
MQMGGPFLPALVARGESSETTIDGTLIRNISSGTFVSADLLAPHFRAIRTANKHFPESDLAGPFNKPDVRSSLDA